MSTDPLSREAVAEVDPAGVLGDVLAQPLQLGDALWRAQAADIPHRDLAGGLVVCGMGGSGVGGDLAAAALGDRATRPVTTVRGYGLEPWTPPDTLVLCASYSGQTEETLACFEAAGAVGAERVVLTTGGKLAGLARAEGVPVIGVPAGMPPRAAVVYMTSAPLNAPRPAAPRRTSTGDRGRHAQLERLVEAWGPDPSPTRWRRRSPPPSSAPARGPRRGPTTGAARRWVKQLKENAKLSAFASELPEAEHNQVCGWERGRGSPPLRPSSSRTRTTIRACAARGAHRRGG